MRRTHNMKTAFMFFLCAAYALTGCVYEEILDPQQERAAFTIVGNPVEMHLGIAVSDLAVGMVTKAEEPVSDYDGEDTEDERHVDDLWIFEYSAAGDLIYQPQYLTIHKQEDLADIQVTLSDNYGDPVTIYVVANSGSGVEEDGENWVVEETVGGEKTYPGFMTIKDLEANALPTPHSQRMIWKAEEGKYVIQPYDEDIVGNISIPMSGYVEGATVGEGVGILVPVDRMFAKLMIGVDFAGFDDTDEGVSLYALSINNIPEYCRVGTLWDGDTGDTARAADYSECKQWIQRRFTGDGMADDFASKDDSNYPYNYIIYIPENIQGENSTTDASDKADNVPSTQALNIEASVTVTLQDEDWGDIVVGPYNYTAYSGGNSLTNFNVRRNCVYRLTMTVHYPMSLDAVPSANCIVCLSGQTTTFFPYCREETGGGYDFENYLYAKDDSVKPGQKIDHVGIIWQSTDGGNTVNYSDGATGFIGNNNDGKLVQIDSADDVGGEYNRKIYVKIPENKTGNALIGAYNSTGEIIWSWHIWARKKEDDPTSTRTKLYYTYEWDENGIHGYKDASGNETGYARVAGYTIMNCNLGAMQDEPAGSICVSDVGSDYKGSGTKAFINARPTFGTLYQWGRKDPFPPVTMYVSDYQYGGTYYVNGCIDEYNVDAVGNYFDNEDKAVSIVGDNEADVLFHSVGASDKHGDFDEMLPLTIQNPTVFYAGTNLVNQKSVNYERFELADNMPEPKDGNWFYDGNGDHFNTLWGGLDPEGDVSMKSLELGYRYTLGGVSGISVHLYDDYGEKSIFDPCPYGWRVSPPDLWLGFTSTGLNAEDTLDNVNYNTDGNVSSYSGLTMYLTAWRDGESSFFPCQGTRSPDGCALRVGQCGNYSNATADSGDRVNILHIHNQAQYFNVFETEYMDYYIKSTGNPLRCVRITSVQ